MLIDMKLPELMNYDGRTPKPDDMDAYWERALEAMHALGTGCRLEKAAFQAPRTECFELFFTGVGGAQIHAKFARPAVRKEKLPAVLMFHGYASHSGDWLDKLAYTGAGFAVAALDCRGQGGLSEDVGGAKGNTLYGHIIRGLDDPNPDKLLMRDIYLDTAQLARIVMAMDEVDEARVGATGGSQGGGLTLACAALTPALNRAAPKIPFLCDYLRVWEMDLAKNAYAEIKDYFRRFDPTHRREHDVFKKLGYVDNLHLAHRIRAEVLMFTGMMDEICPPSTQFAAYNRIPSKKRVAIYPDFGHEDFPGAADEIFSFMTHM